MWQIPNNLLNLFPTFGVLKLQANQFTGPVPVPSSYRYFGVLDLSYNSLSGNIPKNFVDNIAVRNYSRLFCAEKIQVKNLSLAYNQLSGSIPSFYQEMEVIDLSNNYFTNIPQYALSSILEYARIINLGQNELSGKVSDELPSFIFEN